MKIIYIFLFLLIAQPAFSRCDQKMETLDPNDYIQVRVNKESEGYLVSVLAYSAYKEARLSELRLEKSSFDKKSSELQIMLHIKNQDKEISSSFFYMSENEFKNVELVAVYSYPECQTRRYTVRGKAKA